MQVTLVSGRSQLCVVEVIQRRPALCAGLTALGETEAAWFLSLHLEGNVYSEATAVP